jgi:hypothetical protein
MTAALVAPLAVALAVLLGMSSTAPTQAQGHAVVLVADSVLYADWSAAQGARPGRRALLRDATGAVVDTLTVTWVRDAITSLALASGPSPSRSIRST